MDHTGLIKMNDMQSRILKWQIASRERLIAMEHLETMRIESLRVEQERHHTNRIEELLLEIPTCYRDKSFDNYITQSQEQQCVKQIAMRYVKTFADRLQEGTGLIFLGNHGTGKTLLALIIYQMLTINGYRVNYEPSLHFLRQLQERNFESHSAFKNSLDHYKKIQLLIIDEATEGFAGKSGFLSEWEKQMLFILIDNRHQNNLCTLMISNRMKQEWIHRLGEGTMDRLSERAITLAFNWHSYRQNKIFDNQCEKITHLGER